MPAAPSARDLAADLLRTEEKERTRVRDLLLGARARLPEARERGLLTELAYGTVRQRGTLDAILATRSRRGVDKLSAPVRTALRLALYQIVYLDRVPVHAAVDHAVSWVRARSNGKAAGYANAVLRAAASLVDGLARGAEMPRRDVPRDDGSAIRLRADVFADPAKDDVGNLAARYSCPRWLVRRWVGELGVERARAILQAGIGRPPVSLRARGDRGALVKALQEVDREGVRAGPVDTAILVRGRAEAAALEAVGRGEAWVQDATAQRVAPIVDPRPGERVLDLCAAPGGKTLHLADLLATHGEVVACDVADDKLERLRALAPYVRGDVRLRVERVEREGPLPFEPASFDAVLVDAPCTNTGVLRRRVEARWRLRPKDIQPLAASQQSLLERALPLVRPGGRLVYTTCSLEPEENRRVVEAVAISAPTQVELRPADVLEVPAGRDADGGFAAVLRVRGP